jgi:phosphoenolpyruvate-protein kinase (PTS system EI component)
MVKASRRLVASVMVVAVLMGATSFGVAGSVGTSPAAAAATKQPRFTAAKAQSEIERLHAQLAQFEEQRTKAQESLDEISKEIKANDNISPSQMFELQKAMQTGSQYLEACSNAMSVLNQAMMTAAKAVKGQ